MTKICDSENVQYQSTALILDFVQLIMSVSMFYSFKISTILVDFNTTGLNKMAITSIKRFCQISIKILGICSGLKLSNYCT